MAYMCKLYSGKECDACGDCEEKTETERYFDEEPEAVEKEIIYERK